LERQIFLSGRILTIVWLTLIALTALTIIVAGIDLGLLNILAVLAIATAKACLVALFFMDLRHEERLYRNTLFVTLLVFGLFLGLTFFDIGYRY
jgi:cytochrome c oxidase subunit IV